MAQQPTRMGILVAFLIGLLGTFALRRSADHDRALRLMALYAPLVALCTTDEVLAG